MSFDVTVPGESAFAFSCDGDQLIGFLHEGDARCDIGVLTLVAGGPQYRAGVGRQLVNLARRLSSEGLPVMRFDHRGLGDSEGDFKGFQFLEGDITAAIAAFKARVPGLRGVILWGGCDSATAALINAHKFPEVICVIAGNPFVTSAATSTQVARKHYRSRLLQASFWSKLVRLEYNIGDYAAAALRRLRRRSGADGQARGASARREDFLSELLTGLRRFDGKVLFLMGDRFLLSDEFDALMESSPEWASAYQKTGHDRLDIKGGDQVFSSREAQERMFDAASDWLHAAYPERLTRARTVGADNGRRHAEASS